MRKYAVLVMCVICGICISTIGATAENIPQGTLTIGGSSNIAFVQKDFDEADSRNIFDIDLNGNYFILPNMDIGLGIGFRTDKIGDRDSQSVYLTPNINYYIPVNSSTFFYIGIGYRWYEVTYDGQLEETGRSQVKQTSNGPGAKLGFNIFFNSHVALDIAASYWNLNWDLENSSAESDTENRLYIPIIGIKVFF